jgi:hypothetical protein
MQKVTHERETMTHVVHVLALLSLWLMSGCASTHSFDPYKETVLPLNRAWVSGRQVEYVTTDISDAAMARAAGVNYAPRLRDAIGARPSVLERVYKFPQGGQLSIFQSAPQPVGPDSTDLSYSPLWRLVLVKWIKTEQAHELRTEEELLAAHEKGLLSIEITNIVVNCPITKEISL